MSALYRERLPSSSDASAELVLLHGWGSCSEIWRPLLPALRANFSVTIIDLPGCGRSPLLADMSVESVVQALLAQLPARALYVGWSLGGLLAGELALAAPQRVSGLVRLASNLRFVANEQWSLAMPGEDFAAFYTGLLEQPEKTRKRFNTLQLQGDVSARALRRLLPLCHAEPEALRWGLDCLRELDQRETYAGLSCPVMNIYGSDDALVPAALAETVPAARSLCYAGAGHIPFLSQPEQFVSDIIAFEKDCIAEAMPPGIERHFEKRDVARSFSRAANSYDRAATLQRRVADELFRLLAHQRAPQTLVDLGCGTGYSLPALRQRFNDAQLVGVDLAEGMLAYASEHHSEDCQQWVCGDAEDLPLADARVDLLFSSLSLQWCENVSALFSEIDRVLAPGGKAFIATLGPETLFELREAWQNVDGYAHVNRFIPRQALDTAIAASGLRVQWREATEVLYYPTVTALTRELKQLGVSNVNRDRPQGLASRKRLQALQQAYEAFRQPAGLPASYQVWYLELDKQPQRSTLMTRRQKLFIAGTDTDAGKTLIACGVLEAARQQGLRTLALKPVAAGAEPVDGELRNDDALALMSAMSEPMSYEQVNPVVFAEPIAPHIAAERAGRRLSAAQLAGYCRGAMMRPADLLLVEGAGGWRVPLNQRETLADLVIELNLPVVLVVGMKLGCINHALLSAEAIRGDGLPLAGWVANRVDPEMARFDENLETLKAMLPAPCLGVVPHLGKGASGVDVAPFIDLAALQIP